MCIPHQTGKLLDQTGHKEGAAQTSLLLTALVNRGRL